MSMGGKQRWRTAFVGSLLFHVVFVTAAGALWGWESIRLRQPMYVEVTMAELFSPVEGEAGGGGKPAGESNAPDNRPTTRSDTGVANVAESRASNSTAAPGAAGNVPGGVSGGGTVCGIGGGTGAGQGPGTGTGAGTGTGPTRGPRIVDGAKPEYPDNARNKGWEGTVRLQILVGTEGRVEEVRVIGSSGYAELDQAAQRVVRSWRFSPALQKGVPVAAWATLPVVFDLR